MERYLEYRESLGYSVKAMDSLRRLDRHLVAENVSTFKALTPLFFLKMRTALTINQNTINKVIYALRGFFQYLVRIEFCQHNPLAGIPRFKENNIIPFILIRRLNICSKQPGERSVEKNRLFFSRT